MPTRFKNVRILRESTLVWEDLWVGEDGKVLNPMDRFYDSRSPAEFEEDNVVNCYGMIAAPGFIDLQCNGAYGVDFSSADNGLDDVLQTCRSLLKTGVTSFCPTLISSSYEEYSHSIPLLNSAISQTGANTNSANILGLHLEGPYFSKKRIGAHNAKYICEPTTAKSWRENVENTYGQLPSLSCVKIVTLAPELTHMNEIIPGLTSIGIKVSMGHTSASMPDGLRGYEHGARMITHLFNAMRSFHHRDPGLIGLLGSPKLREELYYGIIVDGIHCHPSSVNIAYQAHPRGLVLVTDAISAAGLGTGRHKVGTMEVDIVQGELDGFRHMKATLRDDSQTLAGSVITMNDSVKNLRLFTNSTTEYVLEAASMHPAKFLGIYPQKGSLNFGSDADFVLLDDTLDLHNTYISGKEVYNKETSFS